MNPVGVAVVLLALVAATTALGMLWKSRQGRVSHASGTTVVTASDLPGIPRLATGATLLQFSTDVCAPCTATHTVLGDVASRHGNVTHIDLDVTHRPDLAGRFHIMQTPTTLILDGKGVIRARIGGAPRRDTLLAELHRVIAT